MRLFITKIWNWWDVWLLKWCAFLFGIAAGAYFHDYVIKYVLVIVVAAILLGYQTSHCILERMTIPRVFSDSTRSAALS